MPRKKKEVAPPPETVKRHLVLWRGGGAKAWFALPEACRTRAGAEEYKKQAPIGYTDIIIIDVEVPK